MQEIANGSDWTFLGNIILLFAEPKLHGHRLQITEQQHQQFSYLDLVRVHLKLPPKFLPNANTIIKSWFLFICEL